MTHRIIVGTAGWNVPRTSLPRVADDGTQLQRYARILDGTEINSSFHRPHATATYAKWAISVPVDFQFAVKMPRTITHDAHLRGVTPLLRPFLDEIAGLGLRRGPLLVQLPPSLFFDARIAGRFFGAVRDQDQGPIVCEPRHETWFSAAADRLLVRHRVARAAADPPRVASGGAPGAWMELAYFRLHGSPRMYWSRYGDDYLATLADTLRIAAQSADVWCIFDNTASGAAFDNAASLRAGFDAVRIAQDPPDDASRP